MQAPPPPPPNEGLLVPICFSKIIIHVLSNPKPNPVHVKHYHLYEPMARVMTCPVIPGLYAEIFQGGGKFGGVDKREGGKLMWDATPYIYTLAGGGGGGGGRENDTREGQMPPPPKYSPEYYLYEPME